MVELRKAAEMALEALSLAKSNHGVMLLSDPPQDAWKFHRVDANILQAIEDLRTALAQPDNTSDSATRSADSAESFCKQELHNLMSVAGRMALELECLLLDTKDLSVVSKWWDTGMESLQAYRHYVWSVTHGKDGEHFCDTHCVHTDHHPDCELAQPEQEPVAWLYDWKDGVEIIKDWITSDFETTKFNCAHNIRPLYATPISEPVKERISEPVENFEPVACIGMLHPDHFEDVCRKSGGNSSTPLYTAPPKPEWEDHTPPECKTDGEKLAFAFGWWKALEVNRKEWVGLTDEEIDLIYKQHHNEYGQGVSGQYERVIEAKLREKNT